ncbi:MAG: helix-turn-helix domain-containing protein [Sphingobacterium sp.]|nr:helix-turn-helix domain-containing protein [Sphingobacterium sp.]
MSKGIRDEIIENDLDLEADPNYMNVLTKKTLGLTAKELIYGESVVLEAKCLLKGSDESIKQIVYNLGLYTIVSFSNYLEGKTGIYPSRLENKQKSGLFKPLTFVFKLQNIF